MNHSLGLIARDMSYYGISYGNLFPVDVGQQALCPPYSPLDASIPVWVADPAMVSSGLHTESCWLEEQGATATNPLYALNGALLLLVSDAGIDNKYVCSPHYAT